MSKEKAKSQTLTDSPVQSVESVEPAKSHRNAPSTPPASRVLLAAFAAVLIGGAAYGLSRTPRLESEFYNAISNSGASLLTTKGVTEKNGLEDYYALVEFSQNRDGITRFLGFCETSPDIARNVFRRAMDEGNKNARLVGISAAFYLAQSRYMTSADWDRVVARLNPERESEPDVRRVAQRAVADLLLIKESASKGAMLSTPTAYKETDSDAPSARTELRDFKVDGVKHYQARWTSAALAWAWLQQQGKSGKWDDKMQRFIVE